MLYSYTLLRTEHVKILKRHSHSAGLVDFYTDVGLRRTCVYYLTSARAMCVRRGFGTVRAEVHAYGQLSRCDLRSHFFTCFSAFILSIILDLTIVSYSTFCSTRRHTNFVNVCPCV